MHLNHIKVHLDLFLYGCLVDGYFFFRGDFVPGEFGDKFVRSARCRAW